MTTHLWDRMDGGDRMGRSLAAYVVGAVLALAAVLALCGCKPSDKPSGPDAVAYESLRLTYGGFDGARASRSIL